MSYTLTPVIVDLERVTTAIGSQDTQLIRDLINARVDEMLDIDALGESFDDFEDEMLAEYAAYKSGDFSYEHTIVDRADDPDQEDDDDSDLAEIKAAFLSGDTESAKEGLAAMMKGMFAEGFDIEIGDDGHEEDTDLPRELSTGGALCDLILGRPRDPQYGDKYGYAFMMLCEHLGNEASHEQWHSIDSSAFSTADQFLQLVSIGDKPFSIQRLLVDRGSPCPLPTPDDFPFIGYLTADEVERLDLSTLEDSLHAADSREWLGPAMSELANWITEAQERKFAIVTFYA